ncbi:hypothetical protein BDW74DRAFT_144909 [Aspergillus multicolor]|uniref:uncharacterized protein n=1 Tax=Aspergillus multicolor TaxID=41759 RepID=UPI003CCCE198
MQNEIYGFFSFLLFLAGCILFFREGEKRADRAGIWANIDPFQNNTPAGLGGLACRLHPMGSCRFWEQQ